MVDLRITEIFYSIQGESSFVGYPTVFIRLTGCPLRCNYCDTAYAFSGGIHMSLAAILAKVRKFSTRYVTVTGGEPMAQPGCPALLQSLCDAGYSVSLETSGAMPLENVDTRVHKIMDLKTPASGELERNRFENLATLTTRDEIKFVIANREDFDWSLKLVKERHLDQRVNHILFSPVYQTLEPAQLADWILAENAPVRMQLQMHKLLWGNTPGR